MSAGQERAWVDSSQDNTLLSESAVETSLSFDDQWSDVDGGVG